MRTARITTVRVALPFHLRNLADVDGEVSLDMEEGVTITSLLDALEERHPELRGTIRDHRTKQRRAFLRYFAGGEDVSYESPDRPLPEPVASGSAPFTVIGAISGG